MTYQNTPSRFAGPVEQVLQKHALDRLARDCSISTGYQRFIAEVKRINTGEHPDHPAPATPYPIPAKRTYFRRCAALRQSATMGPGRSKATVGRSCRGRGRPLTADHAKHKIVDQTPLDVQVVDSDLQMVPGKPTLTIAMDVYTRAVVGWRIHESVGTEGSTGA